jgi:uncharacterized protein (TIGR03790 family)
MEAATISRGRSTGGRRLLLAAIFAWTLAAQGPPNVLIVVNNASPESAEIATHYGRRRGIPKENVCVVRTSIEETVSRETFERELETPIGGCLAKIKDRPILYIVTTKGVPLRVEGSSGLKGTGAAVDSELATLYARRRGIKIPLEGPAGNPYFRKRQARFDQNLYPIYLVTRLSAYSVTTVRRMIDDSLRATNRGRFVIDMREGGEEEGESWLRDTAILLPEARVVFNRDGTVIKNQSEVIGFASWGSNDKNRTDRLLNFRWLPGSIMTEFVSTNGRTFARPPKEWNIGPWSDRSKWFAGAPQTLAADYLEEGATGASGHVNEPFLQYTPRPELLLPAYYSGRNLAESYYLAMPALSWMNIVLGDPLCSLGPPK